MHSASNAPTVMLNRPGTSSVWTVGTSQPSKVVSEEATTRSTSPRACAAAETAAKTFPVHDGFEGEAGDLPAVGGAALGTVGVAGAADFSGDAACSASARGAGALATRGPSSAGRSKYNKMYPSQYGRPADR